MKYDLVNAVERNARYPDTFKIPSRDQVAAIEPGDVVKLGWEATRRRGIFGRRGMFGGERMWVRIVRIDGDRYTGTLDNRPVSAPLRYGDDITFAGVNVMAVMAGHDCEKSA
jgi:hypothetical protein